MVSITEQESLLVGYHAVISVDKDVNVSLIKPDSHLKNADHSLFE